jgi:Immunoglobulin I-set domain
MFSPTPTVTWVRRNGGLPEGRYALSNANTVLTIDPVDSSDQGVYECTGQNSVSSQTLTIQLNVQGNNVQVLDPPAERSRVVGSRLSSMVNSSWPLGYVCCDCERNRPNVGYICELTANKNWGASAAGKSKTMRVENTKYESERDLCVCRIMKVSNVCCACKAALLNLHRPVSTIAENDVKFPYIGQLILCLKLALYCIATYWAYL